MSTAGDVQRFLDDLESELRAEQLSILDAPFLEAVEEAAVSKDQISAWATEFYRATKNGRVILGNFYANSPDDPELRRDLAENLYEEETGRLSGVGKCHMDLFLDFLAACGLEADALAALTTQARSTSPQGRRIAPDDFYVELTAYGISVESPNAEFCERIAKALSTNYGFTPEQLTWFTMHASLDADHGAEFRHHAARAAEAPDGLGRVREATLALSATVRDMWDASGSWRRS